MVVVLMTLVLLIVLCFGLLPEKGLTDGYMAPVKFVLCLPLD